MKINKIENQRQALQAKLDGEKTRKERNIMGQFSTPSTLANDILIHAKNLFPKREKVRFRRRKI